VSGGVYGAYKGYRGVWRGNVGCIGVSGGGIWHIWDVQGCLEGYMGHIGVSGGIWGV